MSDVPVSIGEQAGKAQEPTWTILSLLDWTTKYLREHGSGSPRLDAEVLLAHARGCQRIQLYMSFDEPASAELRATFRELVRQRAQGAPVAYLVGTREFFSRPFKVNADVLIPRPETEFILIALLELIQKQGTKSDPWRIADVGTGSGILAISAALELPNARIQAIDLSPAALRVAESNAELHNVRDRVEFHHADIAGGMSFLGELDYIISNPPYVKTSEMASLARDVREFEPNLALEGGGDGLKVIRPLIATAAEKLKSGGYLIFEISPQLEQSALGILRDCSAFEAGHIRRDLSQLPRVVFARRNGISGNAGG